MKIQVLGTGCPKCQALEKNAKDAVAKLELAAEVVKVSDLDEIMEMGVMMTPALAVDGEVKKVGKILTVEEIVSILEEGK